MKLTRKTFNEHYFLSVASTLLWMMRQYRYCVRKGGHEMTKNQIDYQALLESQRANRAGEQLKREQNAETKRSNLAQEMEANRSHVAQETETARSNLAKELETNRSNIAREVETNRSNLAKELENNRHAVVSERQQEESLAQGEDKLNIERDNLEVRKGELAVKQQEADIKQQEADTHEQARSDEFISRAMGTSERWSEAELKAKIDMAINEAREKGLLKRQNNEFWFKLSQDIIKTVLPMFTNVLKSTDSANGIDRTINSALRSHN